MKKRRLSDILSNTKHILILWILVAVLFSIQGILTSRYNNYLIFEYSFSHLWKQISLYASYPSEYRDAFHSGPLFAVLMAPFYLLPDWLGLICWNLLNVLGLFWAIKMLPVEKPCKVFIYWLALPDIIASTLSEQFNPLLTVFILLAFIFIRKDQPGWSALFIVLGTLMKLYGIVGLAFFFFTSKKQTFILYLLCWSAVLFILPMLFSSPSFIVDTYQEWLAALTEKNATNVSLTSTQDVSLMGLARRVMGDPDIPSLPFLVAGTVLFGSIYLRVKRFTEPNFQLLVLAGALIAPVIFSTGSEDVTYILAVIGAGLYLYLEGNTIWRNLLLVLIVFVSIVPLWTILPLEFRVQHPFIYVFKVIPYLLVWLSIIYRNVKIHYN